MLANSVEELRTALGAILEELLAATRASRTTLRLDVPEMGIGVDDPIAEARMPDVRPLSGETGIDQRSLKTVQWIARNKRSLVQNSCQDVEPAPPQALIEVYGVQAQMLAPIIRDDEMVAWVSVHENRGTRDWAKEEIEALENAAAKVHQVLDSFVSH